jgi:hypothetical protein
MINELLDNFIIAATNLLDGDNVEIANHMGNHIQNFTVGNFELAKITNIP